jgi:hypothetical protein
MARRIQADFDSEILQRLGNRTDITAVQRGHFLHDGYLRVAKAYDHVELQGTGSESLNLGASHMTMSTLHDVWWPIQVRNNTDDVLIDPEDKDIIESYMLAPGAITQYYWWQGEFWFNALATQAISIGLKYKKKPIEIAVGQPSVLDEIFDVLIILRAAKIGFETIRDWESAGQMAGLYREYEITNGLQPSEKELLNTLNTGIKVRI